MFKDFIELIMYFIRDFASYINKKEIYVKEHRPKTYGTKIRR
jgi:hypothetical protein